MPELPWLIVTGLSGAIIGIVIGLTLAHRLVQGHYTHLIANQQAARPRPRAHDSRYDEGYYG